MKNFLWLIAGIAAATAGFLVWAPKRNAPITELASRLEEAWADHHTVA